MSASQLRKEIQALKLIQTTRAESERDDYLENLTDEELQQLIEEDAREIGFESEAHFLECAKKFILEHDAQANVTHDYAIQKRIYELFEDFKLFEEFMLKYSSLVFEE